MLQEKALASIKTNYQRKYREYQERLRQFRIEPLVERHRHQQGEFIRRT